MAAPHPQSPAVHTAAPKVKRPLALLALLLGSWLAGSTQAAAPVRSSFDHLTTGFELLGQHRDLPCESCHVNAIFKGTPKYCAACHGADGNSAAAANPNLAGQEAEYITLQLAHFKAGIRANATMQAMAATLSDTDMRALGVYFAQQKPKGLAARDPSLVKAGQQLWRGGNAASGVPVTPLPTQS